MSFAGYVFQFEVEWSQKLHPACLSPVQFVRCLEVGEIIMVGIDNGAVDVAYEVGLPGFECVDNGK
jgi:hypothetical protein